MAMVSKGYGVMDLGLGIWGVRVWVRVRVMELGLGLWA